jgi:hypothetical protein
MRDMVQVERYLKGSAQASLTSHFAVHFADVEHEVKLVTSGCRLVVVYSLVWTGGPQAPTAHAQVRGTAALGAYKPHCVSGHYEHFKFTRVPVSLPVSQMCWQQRRV